jgi:hypothetical protein
MHGFLERVYADYGSIDGYVTDLGLATVVPYLQANLLTH